MSRQKQKRLVFGTKVQFHENKKTGYVLNAHNGFYQILINVEVKNCRRNTFYLINIPNPEQIAALLLIDMKYSYKNIII